jgi:hypothetical protein
MKTHLLTIATLVSLTFSLNAQDIIRTNKDSIKCFVKEIGLDEIKYTTFDNPTGPVNVLEKRVVSEIIFANGTHQYLKKDSYEANPELQIRQKTHAIKFEFLSPLNHTLAFGYEKMIKVGMNVEFKVGIIGPGGKDEDGTDPGGMFIKAGVKFLTSPSYYQRGTQYAHALKGFYIKPELIYSNFTLTQTYQVATPNNNVNYNYWFSSYSYHDTTTTVHYSSGAVNIVFGKQHILGNIFTIDYYLGIGYGFETNNYESKNPDLWSGEDPAFTETCYSHSLSASKFAFSGGISFGVLF